MTNHDKTDNLNYIVDPTFCKVSRLFVLSFKNKGDRRSYFRYYTTSVEIKDFNVVIVGKIFFNFSIKKKE